MVASVRIRLVRSADVLDEADDGAKMSRRADELQNVQRLTEVYKRCPAVRHTVGSGFDPEWTK